MIRRIVMVSLAVGLLAAPLTSCALTPKNDPFGAYLTEESKDVLRKSPNFANETFVNRSDKARKPAMTFFQAVYRFLMAKNPAPQPKKPLPFVPLSAASFKTPPADGFRVTWLGHSTTFIELDGLKIMTDPVFGERASPFSWLGPKRFQKAPIDIAEVPELDAVIISHDHYDHLDMESVKFLDGRVQKFFTPLGVGSHLEKWGIDKNKITELDWWSEAEIVPGVRVAATPAQHFSGRGLFDRNSTLWASWVIIGKEQRLFFSGDTGFHGGFAKIGERYGPFDLAMIENGAYSENWPDVHMAPEETVEAAKQLKSKRFMPIHWGTFNLALHPWYDPAQQVHRLAKERGVTVVQPKLGEFVTDKAPWPVAQWWNDQLEEEQVEQVDQRRLATEH